MPKPRKAQISLDATPYYHVVSRCVRRAFLCGTDKLSGKNFEHRRKWLEERILELAGIFALDVCAFTILHNHHHLVLHINANKAHAWEADEVIEHWHKLFSGTLQSQRYINGGTLSSGERDALSDSIILWRERLTSISWFMRCLNEPLARMANKEDDCTGRFFEGRFKSQALLDDKALMARMAYVDLNPIRAGIAKTPEQSKYTSIKKRAHQAKKSKQLNHCDQQVKSLFPFIGNPRLDMPEGLAFKLADYLELVDWTGRQILDEKRGFINQEQPPILERLGIEVDHWQYLTTQFESRFRTVVGTAFEVKRSAKHFGRKWMQGITECKRLLGTT